MKFHSALVAGATGFIGSALARRLAEEGVTVYCPVRDKREPFLLRQNPRIKLIQVAAFQSNRLKEVFEGLSCEVVFNLAAYGVSQEDCDPELMLDGNVGLVTHLLVATAGWPLQSFIQVGSCSEYGSGANGHFFSEDQPLRPRSLYGAAKAAAVLYGTAFAARLGIPFITLRLFGVFGVGEGPHRLVPYLVARLERNQTVDLTPGGQVRDILYVEDVVNAFLAAANSNHLVPSTVYNICSSSPVRVREIGEIVADVMRKPRDLLKWGERPYRPDEPMWLVGDNRRFTSTTGWKPTVGLREGIKRVIESKQILADDNQAEGGI